MSTTPEGKVKNMVREVLKEFAVASVTKIGESSYYEAESLYSFWPVQNGMGSPSLDCLVCWYGQWIGIETKALGKKPTPRQELTIKQMEAAGALVLVIDGEEGCEALRSALTMLKVVACKR